ncbi:hypothetical protein BD289DRAFT_227713 [Coniella lustricola]|uniref:Uncharacterized protein n=1 Tax=Coniella lustricola TaxID=2025994 RepID=A0A2T3AAQ8_9PEZI|nr:hypothetical protein BD289DRAFT_227713 [Coniella lustricola]
MAGSRWTTLLRPKTSTAKCTAAHTLLDASPMLVLVFWPFLCRSVVLTAGLVAVDSHKHRFSRAAARHHHLLKQWTVVARSALPARSCIDSIVQLQRRTKSTSLHTTLLEWRRYRQKPGSWQQRRSRVLSRLSLRHNRADWRARRPAFPTRWLSPDLFSAPAARFARPHKSTHCRLVFAVYTAPGVWSVYDLLTMYKNGISRAVCCHI